MINKHPLFGLKWDIGASFYLCCYGQARSIGWLGHEKELIINTDEKQIYKFKRDGVAKLFGTLTITKKKKGWKKSGTMLGVFVHNKKDVKKVKNRFMKMYNDEWYEYVFDKCAGNDNPVIVFSDIYTLYEYGTKHFQQL